MNRRGRVTTGAVLLALMAVATGCLDGTATLSIASDRSATIAIEVEPPLETRRQLQDLDVVALAEVGTAGAVTVEELSRSGRVRYRITAEVDDVDQLVAGADPSSPLAVFNRFDLGVAETGGASLDGELIPLRAVLVATSARLGIEPLVPDTTTSLRFSIELPGRVTTTNAETSDGGTAVWSINDLDAPTPLEVRTVADPLLTPPVIALLGAGGVVLLGLVLVVMARIRAPASATPIGGASSRAARRRRRTARPTRRSWSTPAVDEAAAERPAATVPLPWQTVKPTAQDAAAAHAPPEPPQVTAPAGAPTAAVPTAAVPTAGAPTPGAPTAAVPSAVPAGWYPDPEDPTAWRWWDGSTWGERSGASPNT